MQNNSSAKNLSRSASLIFKGFIFLALLAALSAAALNFYPGLSILPAAWGLRMSPYCTVWQAVTDAQVKVDRDAKAKELLAQSHLVRTEGGLKLWSTPEGEFWVPDSSGEVLAILLAQQKQNIYGDAAHGGVRAGDIVLDGGAHIGLYTKTALEAGAQKVIAIDPSPEALACLRRNFAKEVEAGRVVIYPKGLWDQAKELVLFANGNGAAGDSFVQEGANARRIAGIPVTTVDKLVAELGLPRVDLIKADIKGAGERMLIGAADTIRKYHPRVVISTEEDPDDPRVLRDRLLSISSDYQFRPGPCLFNVDQVYTDVVFFQ